MIRLVEESVTGFWVVEDFLRNPLIPEDFLLCPGEATVGIPGTLSRGLQEGTSFDSLLMEKFAKLNPRRLDFLRGPWEAEEPWLWGTLWGWGAPWPCETGLGEVVLPPGTTETGNCFPLKSRMIYFISDYLRQNNSASQKGSKIHITHFLHQVNRQQK